MTAPVLVETVTDSLTDKLGTFERRWMCEPPAEDAGFYILEDEWDDDFTVQTIKRIRVAK